MSTRSRNWTFLVYPESAPENWIKLLEEKQLQFAISPLHDKDKKETEYKEEEKKHHWHVILKFNGNKSYEQVKEISQGLLNGTRPEIVGDMGNMLAYFIHKNHPNKYQYDPKDIIVYGSFDLSSLLLPSPSQQTVILGQIMDFCLENKVMEYSVLCDYCRINHFDEWFYVISRTCTVPIKAYLSSFRHRTAPKEGVKDDH